MPYRRLPNTDQARLKSLEKAIIRASEADFSEQVIRYQTLSDARKLLTRLKNQVVQYQDNVNSRVTANKQYRKMVQNARMYISHFIQVFNLAVIRGEIRKDQKTLYKLDPDSHTLPSLVSEEDLIKWGKNIIEGEEERVRNGGYPIQNPSIMKVRVHYDIFCENQINQNMHKTVESRVYEDLGLLRTEVDQIIVDIWNQTEEYYKDYLPYAKLKACQNYGVIYYYRTGESKLTPEGDLKIKHEQELQPKLL